MSHDFHVEIGDPRDPQSIESFRAISNHAAWRIAQETADATGCVVTLFPGPILSGVEPIGSYWPRAV